MKLKNKFCMRHTHKCGFSILEIIATVAILAIMTCVLSPFLLSHVERSRASKDLDAMDKVTHSVELGISNDAIYNEILQWSESDNVSCYIDSTSETVYTPVITRPSKNGVSQYTFDDGSRTADGVAFSVAGNMKGLTITFEPIIENGKTVYNLENGIINKYGSNTGHTLSEMPELYAEIKRIIGESINSDSQTYKHSEFTIFIGVGSAGSNDVNSNAPLTVYGQYGGTNLTANMTVVEADGRQTGRVDAPVETPTEKPTEKPETPNPEPDNEGGNGGQENTDNEQIEDPGVEDEVLEYYSSVKLAIEDINNGTIGENADRTREMAVAGIYTDDNGVHYCEVLNDAVFPHGLIIGNMIISGGTAADPIDITVIGDITLTSTIRLNPACISTVTFNGTNNAKFLRSNEFTGQLFYTQGDAENFHSMTFNNMTVDSGAIWSGEIDPVLNRGIINEGVKATGSVLCLSYTNVTFNNSILQNHDDAASSLSNAVVLRYNSTINFNNSVVKNNNCPSNYYFGGVVTITRGGTVKTNGAEVYGNSANMGGFVGISATKAYGGIVEVYNSKFHNNYASSGALFRMQCNSNIGYLLIDGCEFYENASGRGLIYEHAYSRPVIIKNSKFHDNECAVWDCHTDPMLDLSGKITIVEDDNYNKYLFESPLVLSDALTEGSCIPLSEHSITQLMTFGYIATATEGYQITAEDVAKMIVPETYYLSITDVNDDGILDVVANAK